MSEDEFDAWIRVRFQFFTAETRRSQRDAELWLMKLNNKSGDTHGARRRFFGMLVAMNS
jgi:hypothetical protein